MLSSPITLVMLPGLDGSGVFFRPLLAKLTPRFRPIVIPFPPDRAIGYEELLPVVLAKLPTDNPFLLLAESYSGPLAIMIAAKKPTGLVGLILSATFIRNPTFLPASLLLPLAKPWFCAIYPAMSRFRFFRGKALNALTAEALSGARADVIAARLRAGLNVDVADELRRCELPILYFRGSYDLVVPAKNSRQMLQIYPAIHVVKLPCNHLVLQVMAESAAGHIEDFVKPLNAARI